MTYKENEKKPRWRLIDFKSLEEVVRVLEFGEQKYGAKAYVDGEIKEDDILDSMQRHLVALFDQMPHDNETGFNHAAHLAANCLIYLHKYSDYEPYENSL